MFMLRVTLVSDSVNVNVNTEHVDQTKQTFLRDTSNSVSVSQSLNQK